MKKRVARRKKVMTNKQKKNYTKKLKPLLAKLYLVDARVRDQIFL